MRYEACAGGDRVGSLTGQKGSLDCFPDSGRSQPHTRKNVNTLTGMPPRQYILGYAAFSLFISKFVV